MSENLGLPERLGHEAEASRTESVAERRSRHQQALEEYKAFVADALEHHARTGEWPPDPLLDEVAEMRRKVMAEHGNDWRKLLRWYIEQDKLNAEQDPDATVCEDSDPSARVSGR